MSEEIDKLKASHAKEIAERDGRITQLEQELASLQAKPKQQIESELDREIWNVLKFFGDSSGEFTAAQIAGHFGIKESIAEHHIAILAGQNLLAGHPSIARLRMIGRAELAWKISPLGTHILLTATPPA